MAEEEQEQQVDENKRVRPRERARGQKIHSFQIFNVEAETPYSMQFL